MLYYAACIIGEYITCGAGTLRIFAYLLNKNSLYKAV